MTVAVARPEGPVAIAAATPTGLATRVLAFVTDALIIDVVIWLVGGAVAVTASALQLPDTAHTALLAGGAVIGALWAGGYFVFFWSTTGQTPGNRLMRIRVRAASHDGPLRPIRAVWRLVGVVASLLALGLPLLMILFDARRRGVHDIMGRSIVVDVPATRRPRTPVAGP
jgi:uncharacterized RDD family membrane protein YckC